VTSVVDGLSQSEDIAEIFASKYQNLYSSVSYDCASMDTLRSEVCERLAKNGYDQHCVVSSSSVADAMGRLIRGKDDRNSRLSSNHFMHAFPELSVHVSLSSTDLLTHCSRHRNNSYTDSRALRLLYTFLCSSSVVLNILSQHVRPIFKSLLGS
jgi:hypothetical protein